MKTKVWFIVDPENNIVKMIDGDNHGYPVMRHVWDTKTDLVRWFRSYGYSLNKNKTIVYGDKDWTICSRWLL